MGVLDLHDMFATQEQIKTKFTNKGRECGKKFALKGWQAIYERQGQLFYRAKTGATDKEIVVEFYNCIRTKTFRIELLSQAQFDNPNIKDVTGTTIFHERFEQATEDLDVITDEGV